MASTIVSSASNSMLPDELHKATRLLHASLNRAIMARLPLCLPPHTSDPHVYAMGMTAFQQIYTAFETAWERLENDPLVNERQKDMMQNLNCLHRSARIQADLERIRDMSNQEEQSKLDNIADQMSHFRQAIMSSVESKPHVLLAYSWTMYLALFNGGRWIVNQLVSPSADFWFGEQDIGASRENYLSFWFFDETPSDHQHGESVKLAFKQSFNAAAELLTHQERADVIDESQRLFKMCIEMVENLDILVQATEGAIESLPQDVTANHTTVLGFLTSPMPLTSIWDGLRTIIAYAKPNSICSPKQELRPNNEVTA